MTTHCDFCNRGIKTSHYPRHLKSKTHQINSGEYKHHSIKLDTAEDTKICDCYGCGRKDREKKYMIDCSLGLSCSFICKQCAEDNEELYRYVECADCGDNFKLDLKRIYELELSFPSLMVLHLCNGCYRKPNHKSSPSCYLTMNMENVTDWDDEIGCPKNTKSSYFSVEYLLNESDQEDCED